LDKNGQRGRSNRILRFGYAFKLEKMEGFMLRMSKTRLCLVVLVLIAAVALAGCGNGQPATGGGDSEALPEVRWTLQTTWSQGWLLHEMAEDFAQRVSVLSDGKFQIDVQPAGAIVGGLEVLDATDSGTIDAYHSWPGYWMGKHPSAPFFASIPLHFEPLMHATWLYNYGGKELYQEMMDEAGQNVIVLPGGVTGPELLAHSNEPLETKADWQGLKYRAPGWWGEVLKEQGVAVTMLPGTELYPSLERGILDATEFSTPAVNRQQGFHEVAQYIAGPGLHQPSVFFELGFNKQAYESLPDVYKAILENASYAMTLHMWTKSNVEDMKALDYFDEIGIERTYVSPELQREFREEAWAWIDNDVQQKGNDHYTRTWASVSEFWERFLDYESFMIPVRE
jgi:TRAP-type mannitol/chloroaromatic compound transport system substrate-binding protein